MTESLSRVERLRQKALQAKQALAAGQTSEFVEESKRQQAAEPLANNAAAGADVVGSEPAPEPPVRHAKSSFGGLARGRLAEEPPPAPAPATVQHVAVPTAGGGVDVALAPPAATGGGFAGLSRGRLGDDAWERDDEDSGPATAPVAAAAPKGAFADLARRSGERRRQLDAQEAARVAPAARQAEHDPEWQWPELPAGSAYSMEEWAAARAQGDVYVWEVRNAGECALIMADRPPPQRTRRVIAGGKPVDELVPYTEADLEACLDPVYGMVLDGCLLLAPSAKTTHPGAVNGVIEFSGEDSVTCGPYKYRLVRPQAQRETQPFLFGMKMRWHLGASAIPSSEELSARQKRPLRMADLLGVAAPDAVHMATHAVEQAASAQDGAQRSDGTAAEEEDSARQQRPRG